MEGFLYRQEFYLSSEQQALARRMIEAALEQIHQLRERYSFDVDEQSLSRSVAAEMSSSWENLMDVRSSRLAGYVHVDPRVQSDLEPDILRLAALALKLSIIFEKPWDKDRSA